MGSDSWSESRAAADPAWWMESVRFGNYFVADGCPFTFRHSSILYVREVLCTPISGICKLCMFWNHIMFTFFCLPFGYVRNTRSFLLVRVVLF